MNQLINYLRANCILDFGGSLSIDMVRDYLKDDRSMDSRKLLAKLVADGGTDELLLVLADCLMPSIQDALSKAVVRKQLVGYSEE